MCWRKFSQCPLCSQIALRNELGSLHLLEAGGERSKNALRTFQRAIHGVAARVPEHHAGSFFLQVEEIEALAEDAMV